ncbi:MAG: glycosyltransferase family 4 protein [Blastocatellia bacterium]
MTRPKLLMVGNFLSATHGVRGVCEELALRLPPLGWPVLTTSSQPGKAARLLDMLRTTWQQREAYAVSQVDVYSGAAFVWAEAVCWLLRRAGKPYILTLHGGNLPTFARRWPQRVRRLLASAQAVTAPSRYLREALQHLRADIRIQPNPLDLRQYEFRWRRAPQPRLVWLRAFHEMYNPTLAVEVVAQLAAQFPSITLLMIGPDKGDGSWQRVQAAAERWRVADRITFTGAVPKTAVAQHLQHGDIFLNTTNVDNTPVSVLEAMACGLCVVSTNVGGLPYLLTNEGDALLVPHNDAAQMAAAVARVVNEPELAARLSQCARHTAAQCDWDVVLQQWDALLRRIMREEA